MSKYEYVDDEYEQQLADMGAEVLYAGRVFVAATQSEAGDWARPEWTAHLAVVKPSVEGCPPDEAYGPCKPNCDLCE